MTTRQDNSTTKRRLAGAVLAAGVTIASLAGLAGTASASVPGKGNPKCNLVVDRVVPQPPGSFGIPNPAQVEVFVHTTPNDLCSGRVGVHGRTSKAFGFFDFLDPKGNVTDGFGVIEFVPRTSAPYQPYWA